MNAGVVVVAVLLLVAAALLAMRSTARRRLARLRPPKAARRLGAAWTSGVHSGSGTAEPGRGGIGREAGAGAASSVGRIDRAGLLRRLAPVLVGLAAAVLVGGWIGLVAGPAVGLAVGWLVRRMPSPSVDRERDAAAAELPYAVDLLAATLKSGAPLDRAVAVVGAAIAGSLGARLAEVGRALRLGVAGEAAWHALDDVPGAEGFVPAAVRAADSGAALAAACTRCAADLRESREARAEAAAQKASVWIVLPLGFCFLPAFVLVGVVPIVLGVLDELLR